MQRPKSSIHVTLNWQAENEALSFQKCEKNYTKITHRQFYKNIQSAWKYGVNVIWKDFKKLVAGRGGFILYEI